ncbi:MAG: glycosyltransferase [bacterium]
MSKKRNYPKYKYLFFKARDIFNENGFFVLIDYFFKFLVITLNFPYGSNFPYFLWIKKNEKYNKSELEEEINNFNIKPVISVIMPVYNISPQYLNKAIESVLGQNYKFWELCIYDDASTNKETISTLVSWKEKKDSRIKIEFGSINKHISYASNKAIELATGKYITFLDHDDEFSSIAFYEIIKEINKNKDIEFLYSDSDKITKSSRRFFPVFKKDWSIELFLTNMYVCHLSVYVREKVVKLGGLRVGYEGAQDYDLALRYLEDVKEENIFHIKKILYHWRMLDSSTAAGNLMAKSYAIDAGKRALEDYAKRLNIDAVVVSNKYNCVYKLNNY